MTSQQLRFNGQGQWPRTGPSAAGGRPLEALGSALGAGADALGSPTDRLLAALVWDLPPVRSLMGEAGRPAPEKPELFVYTGIKAPHRCRLLMN